MPTLELQVYQDLEKLVCDKLLLRDLEYLGLFKHTGKLKLSLHVYGHASGKPKHKCNINCTCIIWCACCSHFVMFLQVAWKYSTTDSWSTCQKGCTSPTLAWKSGACWLYWSTMKTLLSGNKPQVPQVINIYLLECFLFVCLICP